MVIKWENIKILNSFLGNEIYLGKTDKSGTVATDKSESRTHEAIAAVMIHMDAFCKENGNNVASYTSVAGTLMWTPKKKEDTQQHD